MLANIDSNDTNKLDISEIKENDDLRRNNNIKENFIMIISKLLLYSFIIVLLVISYNSKNNKNNGKTNYRIKDNYNKNETIINDTLTTDNINSDNIKTDAIKTDTLKTDVIKKDAIKTDTLKTDNIKTDDIKIDDLKTDSNENKTKTKIRPPPKTSYTLKDYKDYYKIAKEGKILYRENLVHSENPIISVIIALYNAEKYINATLKSVQNQRMKDIEIIIVDDYSKDKSVSFVEEAKKEDPRITLTKNKKNSGILYTKSIGALLARGNYIFILDNDDIIVVDDLFDIIYKESTTNNFDIIEFSWIESNSYDLIESKVNMRPFCVHRVGLVLKQPELRRRFNRDERGYHQLPDRFVWGRLIVKDIYFKVLEALGDYGMQKYFTEHEDSITTFLLFKFAYSFKKIDKIGICHFLSSQTASASSQRYSASRIYQTCRSFVNYAELVYINTENDKKSKEEAFWVLQDWVLRTQCKTYDKTLNQTVELIKKFYKDPLVTQYQKNEIKNIFHKYLINDGNK